MSNFTDFEFELWRIGAGWSGRSIGQAICHIGLGNVKTHKLGYDYAQIILDWATRKTVPTLKLNF